MPRASLKGPVLAVAALLAATSPGLASMTPADIPVAVRSGVPETAPYVTLSQIDGAAAQARLDTLAAIRYGADIVYLDLPQPSAPSPDRTICRLWVVLENPSAAGRVVSSATQAYAVANVVLLPQEICWIRAEPAGRDPVIDLGTDRPVNPPGVTVETPTTPRETPGGRSTSVSISAP